MNFEREFIILFQNIFFQIYKKYPKNEINVF